MIPPFVRSYYSLMRGCSSPARLARRAAGLGHGSLVLCDLNSLAGLWEFLAACKENKLRPLVAAEIDDPGSQETAICVVINEIGYKNLCNLITRRKTRVDFSLEEELPAHAPGLIVLSGAISLLEALRGQGLDIAANLGWRVTENSSGLRRWAMSKQVPAVIVPMVHMAEEEEQPVARLLVAIRDKSLFKRGGGGREEIPPYLEGPAVSQGRFGVWPSVEATTESLLGRCSFGGPKPGLVMPPWGGKDGAAFSLREAAYQGACLRYGNDLSEAVVERLEKELGIIEDMGFSSYFLVVRDIVEQARAIGDQGQLRICGRGSGAASLVAYSLQISNVCPLQHGLYFERFLNPGRSDPPDIDIDFSWDERDLILGQVLEKYGSRAAMVSAIIRFQPRMALRETARAFGVPPLEISRVVRLAELPGRDTAGLPEPWPEIIRLASSLHGVPRHISVHPGGVIITPRPISDYVPVEIAAKGVPVIQWDKDGAEAGGLVKIDLLGNRSLGVIRDCIAALAGSRRSFAEEYWRPESDPATKRTVAAGKTMGCFYIESPAMRLLQQRAASGDFEQLVIQSSIIRPAANEFIREYIRRLRGGKWQHLHPRLALVLDETFGLMVYQEDVSRVAVALAGFSHAQADGLRKVMSKKDKVLRLKDYRHDFEQGCAERGISREIRQRLWEMMLSFDGYSFCKPHSASYARVSYQAAYLKTHHPAEFMAAVISNQGGYYSTFAYVSEAKRLGLTILAPEVNSSLLRWTAEGAQCRGTGDEGEGKNGAIRVGLMAIKGLSAATIARLLRCRDQSPFEDPVDFWQRLKLPKDEARSLIRAGALDGISGDHNRSRLFWEFAQYSSLAAAPKGSSLFGCKLPAAPALAPLGDRALQRQEFEVLGFLCLGHPLLFYGSQVEGRTRVCDLAGAAGKRVRVAAWLLSAKLVSTKTGEVMQFLSFEDETGLMEATFFPRVYRRYAALLATGSALVLLGRVEEDYGAVTLTVESVQGL